MNEYALWVLLLLALAGVAIFSERTKNRELLKLHRLLFRAEDYDALCRELETVSCIVLFSKAARAYMRLNGAVTLKRPQSEVEELLRQTEQMKMSKKERAAFEQKKQEYESRDQGGHI